MNTTLTTALAALAAGLLGFQAAFAGDGELHEKHTIRIETSGDAPVVADLREMAVGESRSFVTESGKTIDLIRTGDGVEVYLDGELVDAGEHHGAVFAGDAGGHQGAHHVVHKRVEVVCEGEDDCDELVWVDAEGDYDYETLHADDAAHKVIVIRKHELQETSDTQ